MSVRRAIVEADVSTVNVVEFCRTHGVSRWFFYDLRRRHALEGDVVLEPKSRAPHRVPSRTPAAVEDAIVAVRKDLVDQGLDAGPATIQFHLAGLEGLPSESTIWRILVARGQVSPQPAKAPKSRRSFTAGRVNEVWALDDTDWALADGTGVKILDIVDDCSRFAIGSRAMQACDGPNVLAAMAVAGRDHGWPERFWSDNARVFTLTLANALEPLGVIASHTRPFSPNSNGKVERFHQTLKRWLTAQPRAANLEQLQQQLDAFRHVYNTRRPHRALGRQFPADVWHNAPKTGPADRPITTPTIVTDTIVSDSRAFSGPYAITIGARHNGQRALTIITGNRCHIFVNGKLARTLTLDLTRRSQPFRTT
jgi:transposase InsO family protein